MKIRIERIATPCETEISITCSNNPDEKTKNLIRQLQFLVHDAVVGYKEGEAQKLSLQDVFYHTC